MAIEKQLLESVLESPRLPSIPAVALKIIDLVQQDEVNMDQIAETICQDPALSSKILKTVNSSFYGQPKTISTVNQALIVLGLNSVKTLALGFSLVGGLADAGAEGFDHVAYWKRSLFSATAAKQICNHMAIVQAEEVFIASLLQDVGMLALSQVMGTRYAHLLGQTAGDHRALVALEQEALGGNHAEVGAALVESWGLPPVLAEPIRYHESPDAAPEPIKGLVRVVAAGACLGGLLADPDEVGQADACNDRLEQWFGIDMEQAKSILAEVHREAGEVQRLFALPIDDLGNADDILMRANEALERISLSASKKAQELERNNEQLQQAVHTDALTGVFNRRRFDLDSVKAFTESGSEHPLTIVFLDIDRFKLFNDTHGHVAGDTTLQLFAQALQTGSDGVGAVYRYGGEEFSMLLPGIDQKAAALVAERLRELVDTDVFVVGGDGVKHNVTVSIGVATYSGAFFKDVGQLIKAADRGVYAAKAAGRNCVRIFVPKAPQARPDAA